MGVSGSRPSRGVSSGSSSTQASNGGYHGLSSRMGQREPRSHERIDKLTRQIQSLSTSVAKLRRDKSTYRKRNNKRGDEAAKPDVKTGYCFIHRNRLEAPKPEDFLLPQEYKRIFGKDSPKFLVEEEKEREAAKEEQRFKKKEKLRRDRSTSRQRNNKRGDEAAKPDVKTGYCFIHRNRLEAPKPEDFLFPQEYKRIFGKDSPKFLVEEEKEREAAKEEQRFKKSENTRHRVEDHFSTPQNGIPGSDFFRQFRAKVNYQLNQLEWNDISIPFEEKENCAETDLPPLEAPKPEDFLLPQEYKRIFGKDSPKFLVEEEKEREAAKEEQRFKKKGKLRRDRSTSRQRNNKRGDEAAKPDVKTGYCFIHRNRLEAPKPEDFLLPQEYKRIFGKDSPKFLVEEEKEREAAKEEQRFKKSENTRHRGG
ncbi:PREDICTED: uncharacterized protein LOC105557613 [Vollenhovia emeryi]|uniref:uncharacterized protein LOC105557613 n=1 Tax=Vollenhovia emeryi TaxID=411798 RepID=UPI0005F46F2C|nr:PREDICTED: uncharacterized protein LOC105557613 [Vollenhovia emeryi]